MDRLIHNMVQFVLLEDRFHTPQTKPPLDMSNKRTILIIGFVLKPTSLYSSFCASH
jgi:hypothetical protein